MWLTWCVSNRRKSEIVQIKKFETKVNAVMKMIGVSKKSLKSG